jgi:hypothetical protein
MSFRFPGSRRSSGYSVQAEGQRRREEPWLATSGREGTTPRLVCLGQQPPIHAFTLTLTVYKEARRGGRRGWPVSRIDPRGNHPRVVAPKLRCWLLLESVLDPAVPVVAETCLNDKLLCVVRFHEQLAVSKSSCKCQWRKPTTCCTYSTWRAPPDRIVYNDAGL